MSSNSGLPEPLRDDPKELVKDEADRQATKTELENQKLRLEQQLLRRQLSVSGTIMEWLKSAAVPAALLGAALTFYVGFGQINQAEQNRSSDRFDKALTRLASEKVNERITGVSGLRLFVTDSESRLQVPALNFLANAAAVESDPFVQSAILDVFEDLKNFRIGQSGLNEALRTALEHNRSLSETIGVQSRERIRGVQKGVISRALNLQLASIPSPTPRKLITRLSQADYLEFLGAETGRFDNLDPKAGVPLSGLARLISTLVKLGGTNKDFSAIYCQNCDFTGAADFSGVSFEQAYLARADFSHVRLKGAKFRNADVRGAVFFSADRSGADLSQRRIYPGDFLGTGASFPFLECADLRGADLTGLPLLSYQRDFATIWRGERATEITAPVTVSAQIDKATKLNEFTIVSYTGVADSYLKKHPQDPVGGPLRSKSDESPESPILTDEWVSPVYSRIRGSFAADEANYTNTVYIQQADITATNLDRLRPEVKIAFRGYLDQPSLMKLELIKAFNDALGSDQAQTHAGKANQWSLNNKTYTCDDAKSPSSVQLTLDSGMGSVKENR